MRRFITSAPATLVATLIVAFGVRATAELAALPTAPLTTATFPGIEKLDPLLQQAVIDLSGR